MEWLKNAVIEGLQTLIVLRLEGAPASDTVTAVAEIWITIFASKAAGWNETTDAPRIRAAFLRAAGSLKTWPAPKIVIEFLPPRPTVKTLGAIKMSGKIPDNIRAEFDAAFSRPLSLIKRGIMKPDHTIEFYQLTDGNMGYRVIHAQGQKSSDSMTAADCLVHQMTETLSKIGTDLNLTPETHHAN